MIFNDKIEHVHIDAYSDEQEPKIYNRDLSYTALISWSADVEYKNWGIDDISISFLKAEIEIENVETYDNVKFDFSDFELNTDITITNGQICVHRLEIDYKNKTLTICN